MTAATYQDILDLPDNLIGEILMNQIITQPRPAPKHIRAASSLGINIGKDYDDKKGKFGGWWIFDEPEIHLGNHVVVPDLAGWRRERMPTLPDEAFFNLAPDWICEILSPSTARADRVLKMPIYAEFEINHLWIVDPNLQTLEVFERQNKHWLLLKTYQQDDLICAPPFVELEFSLNALWS
jgi:Uma2 family endonuclease